MKRLFPLKIITLTLLALSFNAQAASTVAPPASSVSNPWGLAYFHGWMTNNNLLPTILLDDIHFEYGQMNSLDLSYELAPNNPIRRFFQPLVSTVEFANNATIRNDPRGTIYEGDTYLMWRWKHFPWDKYVVNTFGFGDGLSYVSKPPLREINDSSNNNAKRLLNFLTVEVTFALPSHPDFQLATRIHHRCGAWGAFGAGNLSSNAIDVGLRYKF